MTLPMPPEELEKKVEQFVKEVETRVKQFVEFININKFHEGKEFGVTGLALDFLAHKYKQEARLRIIAENVKVMGEVNVVEFDPTEN